MFHLHHSLSTGRDPAHIHGDTSSTAHSHSDLNSVYQYSSTNTDPCIYADSTSTLFHR
jgi:hypothetical protein